MVEGTLDTVTNQFSPGAPENYLDVPLEGELGIENTYKSPTTSISATKTWVGRVPLATDPAVYFQLQRKTASASSVWTPVSDAETPVKVLTLPEGTQTSVTLTWDEVDQTDSKGNPYDYRVIEGFYNEETKEFTPGAPANYIKSEAGLKVTNTWQTISKTVEKIWVGEPSADYGLPERTATMQLFSQYKGQTDEVLVPVDTVKLDGVIDGTGTGELAAWKYTWGSLPKYDSQNRELVYSLVETEIPASYLPSKPVETATGWSVTNTYQSVNLTVRKIYYGTETRPPVTIVIFRDGVEIHRLELNGVIDTFVAPNTPYESGIGIGTWPNLPKYQADGETEHVYTVTEIIPPNFPYIRKIEKTSATTFEISNTYSDGTFQARKVWDLGTAQPADTIIFELWRETTDQNNVKTFTRMGAGNSDTTYDGILDGTADTGPGTHGSETREWEYTWHNLPLNGDLGDPTQPVTYRYFARERTVPEGFVIDTTTSTSKRIENVALFAPVTAQKIWGGEAAANGTWFQLFRSANGVEETAVGGAVHLDGRIDNDNGTGELTEWNYTWADMPRYADMLDPAGDTIQDINNPYTYYVRETDSLGVPSVPEGYTMYGEDTLRIVNVQSDAVTATKTWIGGETQRQNQIGPEVYFTLTRRTIFQSPEQAVVVPADELDAQFATKSVALWDADDTPNTVELTWDGLPMSTPQGVPYVYAVIETNAAAERTDSWQDAEATLYTYNAEYDPDNELAISNTFTSPTHSVTANKFWHGLAEGDATPALWLKLYRGLTADDQQALDETAYPPYAIESGIYDAAADYAHSWTVDKFDATGAEYVYTTSEFAAADSATPAAPEGFKNVANGMDQHNIRLIDILATKAWVDLPAGVIPPEITIKLFAGADEVQSHGPVAGSADGFIHVFTGLPSYELDAEMTASEILYTVDEAVIPNGYTREVTGDAQTGFTIKNTYTGGEVIALDVSKVWKDENNQEITDNNTLPR